LGCHPVAVVQYTFTHKQYIEQHNENRIYRKYITIRIHKYTIYKIKQKHTKHTTIYRMTKKNGTKRTRKNVINEKATKAANFI
jgi:hypothetical protein